MMDKFMNMMHLSNDEDEYEEDFYDDDEEFTPPPKKPFHKHTLVEEPEEEVIEEPKKKPAPKVTPIRQNKKPDGRFNNMEVCVIKPTCINDMQEITDTLLANRTVLLNLEGIDVEIGQRIVDFTYGSIYALDGKMQKISNSIFVCTPHTVSITGDYQEILSEYNLPPISF